MEHTMAGLADSAEGTVDPAVAVRGVVHAAALLEEIRAELQAARDAFAQVPACAQARDARDGLRILAAVCSVRIVVPKKVPVPVPPAAPQAEPAPLDLGAVLDRIEVAVARAVQTAQGRLPDRRDWILQNAVELFRGGMQALRRAKVPPPRLFAAGPKPKAG